jgi:hypothetical protein
LKFMVQRGIEKRCNVYVRGLPPSMDDAALFAVCARFVKLFSRFLFVMLIG